VLLLQLAVTISPIICAPQIKLFSLILLLATLDCGGEFEAVEAIACSPTASGAPLPPPLPPMLPMLLLLALFESINSSLLLIMLLLLL
jgi:hypothetical protein